MKLYSTGCPKCKVIEMKLDQLGKPYEIEANIDIIISIGQKVGISSAPILEKDGKFYNFHDALKLLREEK